jgi:hypothetical protein
MKKKKTKKHPEITETEKTNKTENPCKLRSKDPLKTILIN